MKTYITLITLWPIQSTAALSFNPRTDQISRTGSSMNNDYMKQDRYERYANGDHTAGESLREPYRRTSTQRPMNVDGDDRYMESLIDQIDDLEESRLQIGRPQTQRDENYSPESRQNYARQGTQQRRGSAMDNRSPGMVNFGGKDRVYSDSQQRNSYGDDRRDNNFLDRRRNNLDSGRDRDQQYMGQSNYDSQYDGPDRGNQVWRAAKDLLQGFTASPNEDRRDQRYMGQSNDYSRDNERGMDRYSNRNGRRKIDFRNPILSKAVIGYLTVLVFLLCSSK